VTAGNLEAQIIQHLADGSGFVAIVAGEVHALVAHRGDGFESGRKIGLAVFANGIQL